MLRKCFIAYLRKIGFPSNNFKKFTSYKQLADTFHFYQSDHHIFVAILIKAVNILLV